MANRKKEDRVSDTDIKRLNHLAIGLKAIAEKLGCHPATITLRLKALGLKPADTRRSFMEEVFKSLDPDVQDWLSLNLYESDMSVKEFTTKLIREAYETIGKQTMVPVVPVPMPEMDGGEEKAKPEVVLPNPNLVEEPLVDVQTGHVSEKPTPDQKVEPEVLVEVPEEKSTSVPPPVKLSFGG